MSEYECDDANQKRIPTPRCVLVPVTASLAREILLGDYEHMVPADGWPHPHTSFAVSRVTSASPAEVWLVQFEGRTIGDCGTHGPVDATGTVEIGYGLAAPFRGRGYGTEVVAELTRWLFRRPAVKRVTARTAVENLASQKVLEKAGFVLVGSSPPMLEHELSAQPDEHRQHHGRVGRADDGL